MFQAKPNKELEHNWGEKGHGQEMVESPAVPDTAAAKTRGARDVLARLAVYIKAFGYEQRAPERFCYSQHRLLRSCGGYPSLSRLPLQYKPSEGFRILAAIAVPIS